MKFPSIKTLASGAINTVKRFPFETLFALAGTVAMIDKVHHNYFYGEVNTWSNRVMMTANLGLLLSFAATLFTESKIYKRSIAIPVRVIIAILGASLVFALNPRVDTFDYMRFVLLCLAFHLLVSFAAFIGTGKIQGFWQFNKVLFIRILTSMLYSGVLYLGLLLAVFGTVKLFNIDIGEGHIYGYLFAFIAGIFNTLFFLAGVPKELPALDDDLSYPKGLKIFTQYVLIPLATIYFLILLAYEVKIIIEWRMPKGLVSNLVLGYAVFGILSLLLVYPIRDEYGNKWIKIYARWFYFLMIPLIVLLYLAVLARVVSYGITEERYFLLALALWLTFICGYFLLSRKQNIRLIPITLCLLTLMSIYGPLSAFTISENSQRGILTGLFKKYGSYKDGKIVPLGNNPMARKDAEEAQEKLKFLLNNKDMTALQPYFSRDLTKAGDSLRKAKAAENAGVRNYIALRDFSKNGTKAEKAPADYEYSSPWERQYDQSQWLKHYLGLDKVLEKGDDYVQYGLNTENGDLTDVKGYDYSVSINQYAADTLSAPSSGMRIILTTDKDDKMFTLSVNNEPSSIPLFVLADSLRKVCNRLKPNNVSDVYEGNINKSYNLPVENLTIYRKTAHYDIAFKLHQFEFMCKDQKVESISNITGYALIRKR